MIIKNFKILKGYLYGLKQKTILFELHSTIKFPIDISIYNNYVSEILDSSFKLENNISNIEELMKNFIYYTNIFHKNSKLAIYENMKIFKISKQKNDYILNIALPYDFNAKASLDSFYWICESFNFFYQKNNSNTEQQYKKFYDELIKRHKSQAHMGVNQLRFQEAAFEMGIRCEHLCGNTYIFGYGENSRYLESSFSDKTNVLGTNIAKFKHHTNNLLSKIGIPVAKQYVISSAQQACEIATKLSKPVVIKPIDADCGFGVFAGLTTKESIIKSFNEARKISPNIALEEFIEGDDFRLTVFNNKVIKIVQRVAGGVIGDGINNIQNLVKIAQNSQELQRRSKSRGYDLLSLDEEALDILKENNLNTSYIPFDGEYIKLRRKSNISAGGTTKVIPIEDVHPDNIILAIETTKALRLDIAGIDLLIKDIKKSWLEIGGAICEINAQPQIGKNSTPKIYHEILRELLPNNGHIPIVVIVGEYINLSNIDSKLIIGIANKNGAFLNTKQISNSNDLFISSNAILFNNQTQIALIQIEDETMIDNGLAFNNCDFVIVNNKKKHENIINKLKDYTSEIIEKNYDETSIGDFLNTLKFV